MKELGSQLEKELDIFFNENYSSDKKLKCSSDAKLLMRSFYTAEEKLKSKLVKTYKEQPQLIKKASTFISDKLNQEYLKYPLAIQINAALIKIFTSVLSKQAPNDPSPRKIVSFYKTELRKSLEKDLSKYCPKFILKEYINQIKNKFSPFDKSIVDKNKNKKIKMLIDIFNQIHSTKKLPIELNARYFDLFILVNHLYFQNDQPFAFEYLMHNYSFFITAFDLKSIFSKDDFSQKVCELLTLDLKVIEENLVSLKHQLINETNILIIICSFTLLFNFIITPSFDQTVDFVSYNFIISNRSKELLYNFIKGIAPVYVPEWYALIGYIQGPLIEPNIKPYTYSNKGVISMLEIDSILKDSPLQNDYQQFILDNHLQIGKVSIILSIFDFYKKENDLSPISFTPLNPDIHSTTCNIMISGFLSENDELEHNWKMMVNSISSNEECYFYNWPAQTAKSIAVRFLTKNITSVLLDSFKDLKGLVKEESPEKQFLISKTTSKNAGKILAFILASRKVFTYKTINLIGFSLGVNVIKNCIKQLYHIHTVMKISCDDIIQSTLMMAGASVIRNERKDAYANFYNAMISGRVFHCYSFQDAILNVLFTLATNKNPIGNKSLEIPFLKKLVNCDFSEFNLGHMDYGKNFDLIVKKISFNNY